MGVLAGVLGGDPGGDPPAVPAPQRSRPQLHLETLRDRPGHEQDPGPEQGS